jgi:hypothetical protein
MSNPKGIRNRSFTLTQGGQIMVYSSQNQIFLQLRHEILTQNDILQPSFKVALSLTQAEALSLAAELLQVAHIQMQQKEEETVA